METPAQAIHQRAAAAHAEDLAHCTAELLRYAREGASTSRFPFGLDDIVMNLAQALCFTLQTELAAIAAEDDPTDQTELEQGGQLLGALRKWLLDQDFEAAHGQG